MYPGFDTKTFQKNPYLGEQHRQFIEQAPYPLNTETPTIHPYGNEVTCTYAVPLWDFMMSNMFPGLSADEFQEEKNRRLARNPNDRETIYEKVFSAMMLDVFYSIFEGRDDSLDNTHYVMSQFDALNAEEKNVAFQTYLTTRFHGTNALSVDQRILLNLEQRAENMRIWTSYILLKVLEQVQKHTINTGRLATRHAQTSQSISIEMTDGRYTYRPLVNSSDYEGQHHNQTNTKSLEDLKTFRLVLQKKVDRASSDLTKVNSDTEVFANFINKLFETDLNMIRGLFS